MNLIFTWLFKNWNKIFSTLIILDLLMLIFHLFLGNTWIFFHLDFEQNLPTIYQSFKLIGFGMSFLLLSIFGKIKFTLKTFLIPLSIILIIIGFDELLQIHENIYKVFEYTSWLHPSRIVTASYNRGYRSSLWLLYYLPVILIFVFWSGYWFRYFQSKFRSNYKLTLISNFLLFLIVISELFSSMGKFDTNVYFGLVTIEEVSEMLMASILILVGIKFFNKNFSQD